MVKVSAPGKLLLSGEWAVLNVGNPAIVSAVDVRVHAKLEDSEKILISVDDFGINNTKAELVDNELVYSDDVTDEQKEKLVFLKGAIETTAKYLGGSKPFSIRTWGEDTQIEVDGKMRKVGFGSSAASVVAVVSGVLAYNGRDITKRETKDVIYKLSAMTHYFAQGKLGSAFDVAASTYGGVFVYTRFDPKWLVSEIEKGLSVKEVVDSDWSAFSVEELPVPDDFNLSVGWTKSSASTKVMVKQMNEWAKGNSDEHKRMYDEIASLVKDLIPAWKSNNREKIRKLLMKNEELLASLGKVSGVDIETEDLKKLSRLAYEAGGAGKLSGAGGGDCGVGISFDSEVNKKIRESWRNSGKIMVLDVKISREGIREE